MASKKGRTVMEVGADGVAIITIINPPLNLLSVDVLLSLEESIGQALQRDDVKAVVITGANGKFSGGFDVTAFGGRLKANRKELGFFSIEFFTDLFEAAKKPIVAAVDGPAFGGGLEIALACHARIATSSAQLGLPELQYGILPGLGGTQRLPRLVGLHKALEMMLTSKPLKGDGALTFGLVDAIVSADELVNTSRYWTLDILERKKPWIRSLYKNIKLEPLVEARKILKLAREQVQKQSPNLKHPLVCIDVIEEGIVSGPRRGLWKEAEALQELRQSDTCKSLVHFFFAQRGTLKVHGITNLGLVPNKLLKVGIVGGGLMGSGIATSFILNNYLVFLKEVDEKCLLAGINRVRENLQSRLRKGKMSEKKLEESLSLLKGVLSYEGFRDVDLVIEAVTENISLKQRIFANLEKYCHQKCIFASNTSMISINLIGEKTKSQSRIVGAHFFNPAHVMPLLEVVHTEFTHPQVIVDLLDLGKKIKKTSIVVGNCTGFAVNRMFFPYTQAAMLLVDRGADVFQIDQAIAKFGMPMGPFRMIDLVGFGVATAAEIQFVEKYPERSYRSMLIQVLKEDGRAGETTRKGFYVYDKNRVSLDPELKKYVNKARNKSGVTLDLEVLKLTDEGLIEMLFFPVINEACRLLAEGIVAKASDLDIASVLGSGFPAYRGGIIFWANSIGSNYICSKLEKWTNMYGNFFKPCGYLVERASKGISLGTSLEQANPRL